MRSSAHARRWCCAFAQGAPDVIARMPCAAAIAALTEISPVLTRSIDKGRSPLYPSAQPGDASTIQRGTFSREVSTATGGGGVPSQPHFPHFQPAATSGRACVPGPTGVTAAHFFRNYTRSRSNIHMIQSQNFAHHSDQQESRSRRSACYRSVTRCTLRADGETRQRRSLDPHQKLGAATATRTGCQC